MNIDPRFADLVAQGAFGLSTAAVIYWLVAHARRVKLIVDPRAAFLVPGALWFILVALYAFLPAMGTLVLLALAGWVLTLQIKSGAKDNERQDPDKPPQG